MKKINKDMQENDIKMVYKYREINDNTFSIIKNNELYFPIPTKLNDPFDSFKVSDHYGSKEEVKKWLTREHLKTLPFYEERYKEYEKVDFDVTKLNNFKRFNSGQSEDVYVCSFSETNNETLLWSHYTNSHEGIALGFGCDFLYKTWGMYFEETFNFLPTIIKNFYALIKVRYEKMPTPYRVMSDDPIKMFDFITYKSEKWKYENEYRFLFLKNQMPREGGEIRQNLKFRKDVLKEVIFGVNSSKEVRGKIINLVNKNYNELGYTVKFKECVKNPFNYEIEVIDFAI